MIMLDKKRLQEIQARLDRQQRAERVGFFGDARMDSEFAKHATKDVAVLLNEVWHVRKKAPPKRVWAAARRAGWELLALSIHLCGVMSEGACAHMARVGADTLQAAGEPISEEGNKYRKTVAALDAVVVAATDFITVTSEGKDTECMDDGEFTRLHDEKWEALAQALIAAGSIKEA
jgi:hypothetical protein